MTALLALALLSTPPEPQPPRELTRPYAWPRKFPAPPVSTVEPVVGERGEDAAPKCLPCNGCDDPEGS